MKISKRKSILKFIIFSFLTYSLIILFLYVIINLVINKNLDNHFLEIGDLLEYKKYLETDSFSKLPLNKFENQDFLVFDEEETIIFSTKAELNQLISSKDLVFINNYQAGEYYEMDEYQNKKGAYYLLLKKSGYEDESVILDLVKLDKDYYITEGNMFGDMERLSKRHIDLVEGHFGEDKTIEKYEYVNNQGLNRTLVFIAREIDSDYYNEVVRKENRLWFLYIPFLTIVIIILTYIMIRNIRKTLRPINDSLIEYNKTKKLNINIDEVPSEFKDLVSNFDHIVERLDEEVLKNKNNEAERQRIIANISHDLKTPLTVIQGYSKAFLDGMVPEDKKDKYLDAIYNKATTSSNIIDSLFEYTVIGQPEYKVNKEFINISDFCKEYINSKITDIELQGFKIDYKIPSDEIYLNVDKKLINRLFDNIINNSIKYNKEGTTIFFVLKEYDKYVRFTLADNGVGISKKLVKNIFEPFVVEDSSRGKRSGTGLGLSIAKKVVDLHDGKIKVVYPPSKDYKTEIEIKIMKP